VDAVRTRLLAADHSRVEDSAIDVDAAVHRAAYLAWCAAAELDPELAAALDEVESDPSANDFAADAGRSCGRCTRPAFASAFSATSTSTSARRSRHRPAPTR
jgi:hypothetical protein